MWSVSTRAPAGRSPTAMTVTILNRPVVWESLSAPLGPRLAPDSFVYVHARRTIDSSLRPQLDPETRSPDTASASHNRVGPAMRAGPTRIYLPTAAIGIAHNPRPCVATSKRPSGVVSRS